MIDSCQKQIQDLYQKLGKLQNRSGSRVSEIIDRVKWPLKKEEYQSTVIALHRFTQTFQFSLQISNWYVALHDSARLFDN
jgi:hypothetical protein